MAVLLGAFGAVAFVLGLIVGYYSSGPRPWRSRWVLALQLALSTVAGIAGARYIDRNWNWDDDSFGSTPIVVGGATTAVATWIACLVGLILARGVRRLRASRPV